MVRDPHSYGNSHEVYPSHLALALTLNFSQRRIDGRCDLTLAWSQPDAMHVDLDTRDLTITGVTDGEDHPLNYELSPPHPFMGSRLRIHLPGRQETVRIVYHTHPDAAALQWLTPAQTTSQRLPFLFTQSQAILARTWIPCMDSPGVRTTYDAVVNVPLGMTAVMGAHHEAHETEHGRFRFTMPYAIPAYLIALAAGELAFRAISDRTGVYAELAVLGRPAFDAFLQQYFEDHAFASMTTDRFLELIRDRLFHGDVAAWETLRINDWIDQPGAPDNMIIPNSNHFERTRAAANAFISEGQLPTPASGTWATAEWLDFLHSLPEHIALDKLQQLDEAFHFSQSGNAEILYAWLAVCIRNTYEPAFPVVEDFLCRQGRRKFLQPLYGALWANPRSRHLAAAIYHRARSGYHPIAVATIDGIVDLSAY